MATISFRDFSQGQPVKTIGDEGKVQTQEQNGGQKLFSQLAERAKTFGKEAVALGTLGASTMTPQDFNATGQDRSLAAVEGLSKAGLAPWNMLGAVGGAVGDVVGAGLEATGLAEPLGEALAPIAQSEVAQKAVQAFQSLPQEYQDYLSTGLNASNLIGIGVGKKVATTGLQKAGQVATETVAPLAKKVLPKLTPDAEQIMQRVARVSKGKQAGFEARAGESIGSYLDKRGIYGDVDQITEQLYNRFQQSKATADEALANLQGNYQPTAVKTALTELQKKLTRVSSEGAVDPNLGKVSGLLAKFDNQGLTMSEINEAKRLYERNVRLDFLKENNPEGITTANNIDNAIRSWQFNQAEKLGLKNLPEINKETMLAKQLLDDLGKEYAGSAGNNMITLTDWIVLSGGDPTAVAGFLTKQGLSSKKVQSFIAKLISKNQPKKGQVTPQTGEATVLPIGTYKDFLKETSRNAKPTTQPQVKKGLSPQPNSTTKEGVVNELINNPFRGSVTPSEFLPKSTKKVDGLPVNKDGTLTMYRTSRSGTKHDPIRDFTYFSPDKEHIKQYLRDGDKIIEYKIKPEDLLKESSGEYRYLKGQGNLLPKKKVGSSEIYHGTDKKFSVFDLTKRGTNEKDFPAKNAFFFTDSLDTAKSYGKNIIKKQGNFEKPLTIDADGATYGDFRDELRSAIEKAQKEGNDVVIIKNLSDRKDWGNYEPTTHYAVLDMNKVSDVGVTKKVASSLEQEAKKYKSAEEFVKAQRKPIYDGNIKQIQDLVGLRGESTSAKAFGKDVADLFIKQQKKAGNLPTYASIKAEEMLKNSDEFIIGSNISDVKETVGNTTYTNAVERKVKEIQAGGEPWIFLDSQNNIIDGNHAFLAYKKLGYKEIPTIKGVSKSQLTDIWKKANKK